MSTDTEQTAPHSHKSRLGILALLFAIALPVMILVSVWLCNFGQLLSLVENGLVILMIALLLCPVLAIVFGIVARFRNPNAGCGGCLAIILGIMQIAIIMPVPAVTNLVLQHNINDDLKQLYCFMSIYADNNNCYPSMQPTNIVPRCNGGVRDLYPLYLMAHDKQALLSLLQPPGVKLLPFSKNPGSDEFDSAHIGYIYNSTVVPDQSDNPPLMAERCAEDGMFTADEKPVFEDCAHILMANGTVRKVPVKNGKLILPDYIKLEDLGKLK